MQNSDPNNESVRQATSEIALVEEKQATAQEKLSFPKLVWVFTIGSVLGYVVEVLFCLVVHGTLESRQGMVLGPFNQVYGFGAVIMTLVLLPIAKKGLAWVFAVGALTGGVFEFTCSFLQESIFQSKSWDFSNQTFDIHGRTSLLFMVFWGILSTLFIRFIYPAMSRLIARIPKRANKLWAAALTLFFTINMFVSATAVMRWSSRMAGDEPANGYERLLDNILPDERMERIYPNMDFVGEAL